MGGDSCPEQQYSLRWNDFHASILSSFRHLRDEEDFVDVTLACDGCSFTAHKVVLSACSPYFRKLLKANPCQHPIVILRDVQQKDMESLLRFMYNGEVHIGQEQLADFLKTAQMLQVRGLADVPTGAPGQRIVTAPDQKISPNSTSLPWATDIQSPRGGDGGSPPPLKRSRSSENPSRGYSPDRARSPSRGNGAEMRESLLGQALEGGPTIHTNSTNQKGQSDSSLQAQSTGEDSNSSDTALSDRAGPVTPKTEPSDYPLLDDHPLLNSNGAGPGPGGGNMMDQARTFPGALLGLQAGLPGLLPGPSGMHNNGPESFDYQQHQHHQHQHQHQRQRDRDRDRERCGAVSAVVAAEREASALATASASGSAGFECPLCEAVLPSLVDIRQHIDMHYPRDSPVCPVEQCARRFTHPNSVRNHMRLKHAAQWEKMKNLKWST